MRFLLKHRDRIFFDVMGFGQNAQKMDGKIIMLMKMRLLY